MSIFLFCKQIVDMLYQFKFLDYGMVLFALVLICYKVWKDKLYKNIREFIYPVDYIVVGLMIIYVLSFLRYPTAYGVFFKVESSFLIYFLGRVYGKKVLQHGKMLACAGYLIVYANFAYRFYQFGFKFFVTGPEETLLNVGGLYYYKTDLTVAVIIAMIFIYAFSEFKVFKWFTIFPVCGYMVLYSGARMQQLVILAVYGLIILHEFGSRKGRKNILSPKCARNISIGIAIFLVCFFIVIEVFPFEAYEKEIAQSADWANSWVERIMHSRQAIWWGILQYFSEQPFFTKILGIDLGTEYLHNSVGDRAHSLYIKQIYATGYIGCFLFVYFFYRILQKISVEKDKKLFYIVMMLWVMFLGSGITIESLEYTQMSWFPMLFTGILFAKGKTETQAVQEQSE
ncbi:MAG: hypothetical protein IJN54_01480 [Lachnospiraceae bacterium]|nr:hypothetical protein [Lachnospiraceae bacterium]